MTNLSDTVINQPFNYKGVELVPFASHACLGSGCYFDRGQVYTHGGGNCKLARALTRACSQDDRDDNTSVIFLPYTEWAKRRVKGEA